MLPRTAPTSNVANGTLVGGKGFWKEVCPGPLPQVTFWTELGSAQAPTSNNIPPSGQTKDLFTCETGAGGVPQAPVSNNIPPSVRPFVRQSVPPCVRPSVHPSAGPLFARPSVRSSVRRWFGVVHGCSPIFSNTKWGCMFFPLTSTWRR